MVVCNESVRPRTSRMFADPGHLILRVRGSGHDGRLIQIRAAKCTIGSAAGCTLRLRAASVGPLHCWILRGAAGAVVRRLHGKMIVDLLLRRRRWRIRELRDRLRDRLNVLGGKPGQL